MNIRSLALVCVATLLAFAPQGIIAKERIREFDAAISIAADGKIMVIETIVVDAEQKKIKRGIFRDFPTLYRSKYGLRFGCRLM